MRSSTISSNTGGVVSAKLRHLISYEVPQRQHVKNLLSSHMIHADCHRACSIFDYL